MLRAFRSAVPRTQLLKSRLTIPKTSVIGRRYLATDSFLQGSNSNYVDEMYEAWRQDPSSVHASWNAYFKNIENDNIPPSKAFQAPPTIVPTVSGGAAGFYPGQSPISEDVVTHLKVQLLVRAYQVRGHQKAKIDPLGISFGDNTTVPKELTLDYYGFTEQDLAKEITLGPGILPRFAQGGKKSMTLKEIINFCEKLTAPPMVLSTYTFHSKVIKYLKEEEEVPSEMKSAIKKYKMHDDLLLYKSFATFKPVVGSEAAKEIIPTFHRQGHVGITKIYWAIQPYVFVPKLLTMITEIVNACDTCQRTKSISRYMGGLMMPSEVPRDCFSHIHVDFITGLPVTVEGYDAIMVVVDALTKYTICCPCKKTYSAMDVAKMLMNEVFSVFGLPHKIISDKDIRFMNSVFDYIYEYYQIQMATTSTN